MAHIDDFECSCYGYLFRHHKEYEKIYLVIVYILRSLVEKVPG